MVVVYGTVCRDRFHRVERLPNPGGYEEIIEEFESVGGEAVNTAYALRKWGVPVALGGNSMGSAEGAAMLAEAGLSADHLPPLDHPEPVCDVYVTPDGQRTMFGRGFRRLASWGDPSRFPVFPGAWFTVDANHEDGAREAAARAKLAGMKVYLEDLSPPSMPKFDIWQSSTDWVAKRGDIQFNVQWLTEWLESQGGFGVLSDGANGFVAGGHLGAEPMPVRHYPPYPCSNVVDSTGAGDVFRAGMLLGLSEGWPIGTCLRFASAAGSLNCLSLGATSAVPDREEIERMVCAHPEVTRNYE